MRARSRTSCVLALRPLTLARLHTRRAGRASRHEAAKGTPFGAGGEKFADAVAKLLAGDGDDIDDDDDEEDEEAERARVRRMAARWAWLGCACVCARVC
jgi:hypothetical protein